jgi:LemA protein
MNSITQHDQEIAMTQRRIWLLSLVIFVAATASGCGYNTLTTKHENVKGKWANVETQLQRRSDLLNNLIETAKLAGVQEQEVFGKIAEARSKLLNASQQAPQGEGGDKSPEQKQAVIDAANSFGGTIGRLLVLQENYPQLKSNENFMKAQDEVVGTENRIATARKDYNEGVQDYNTTRARFPTVISAKLFGFKEEPYFKAEEGATAVPKIDSNTLRPNQSPAPTK